jgi:transcriptional regulator with XRE-family HTH domain
VPAAAPPSPLGVELRWMRNAAGLTGKQAADETGVSQVAVSRWETGKRQPEIESVEALRSTCASVIRRRLDQPDLSPSSHRRLADDLARIEGEDYRLLLMRLVEDASTEVLSTYVITRTGLAERQEEIRRLEQQAISIRHFQPLFVPGQLSTPEYARMVMLGYERDEEIVSNAVEARMRRVADILDGPRPLYHVVISENALDLTFKDAPDDLRLGVLQLIHKAAKRAHITVQIFPRMQPYIMVPIGSFVAYDFGEDDSVVLVDTYAAQVSYKSGRDVRQYDTAWQELIELALDPDESLEWLATAIHEEKG